MKGIDISNWQRDISDYSKLKSDGVEFAILKITEGTSFTDKAFTQHYNALRQQGIQVGAYVFSHAKDAAEAVAEAKFALSVLDGKTLDFPLFPDCESNDMLQYGNKVLLTALAFGKVVQQAGYKWGVYANRSWWNHYLDVGTVSDAAGVVWVAEYGVAVCKISTADIWQYSDQGRISGYGSNVDMNVIMDGWFIDRGHPVVNIEDEKESGVIQTETKPTFDKKVLRLQLDMSADGQWDEPFDGLATDKFISALKAWLPIE